jgi:hypothetical protein
MEFNLFELDDKVEDNSTKLMTSRKIKINDKLKVKSFLKKEKAIVVMSEIPEPGESIHIVSNGTFDYFTLVPIAIELMGGNINDFYFSTWTLNNSNCESILKLYDEKKVKSINCLVGLYFMKREAQVFNMIYEGLKERGQRIFSNENHSKVTLLENGKDFIVICGSANFTSNPRIEQFTIYNSKELFDFHKSWMDEIIK